jgi:hypothetical protein
MTSEKQIKTNQSNASKSTGPKTAKGKAVAKLNSVKHGLLAKNMEILPTENREDFDKLRASLMDDLKPEGELENILMEQIVSATWRLRRIQQIETGLLGWQYFEIQSERANKKARTYEYDPFKRKLILESSLLYNESKLREKEAKEIAESDVPTLGMAFSKSQEDLAKLSRYQVAIERSLYKALEELEKLQYKRKSTEKPMIIDITETLG